MNAMPQMNCVSTYVSTEIDATLMQKSKEDAVMAQKAALATCRAVAIERTGGEDGLRLVDIIEHSGTHLATTWVREWAEPEPEPQPEPAPTDEAV
jgi:hypothetical protein